MRKVVLLFLGMLCLSSNTFAQGTEYKSSDKPDNSYGYSRITGLR